MKIWQDIVANAVKRLMIQIHHSAQNVEHSPNNKPIPKKDHKNLILGLIGIIITLVICIGILTGGFGLIGEQTSILIISESPVSNSANFTIELVKDNKGISEKPIEITFKNNENTYTFNQTTDFKRFSINCS